MKEDFSL